MYFRKRKRKGQPFLLFPINVDHDFLDSIHVERSETINKTIKFTLLFKSSRN